MSTKPRVDRVALTTYLRVWWRLTKLQFQTQLANSRGAAIFFIFGKLFRLATAFLFLYVIVGRANTLAGYNLNQAVFILALFNLTSTLTQLFMRGVYVFRQKIISGAFDFYLLSPLSELFYALFSYTDPMDLLLTIPYAWIVFWAWNHSGYGVTTLGILYLFFAIFIMGIFAFTFHTLIISIGIRYLEVDNSIMLYRDLEKMAAFPIEIYGKYLGAVLTYLAPFAVMATIPARIIFGLASPSVLFAFLLLSIFFLYLSLIYWHDSIKTYSSASS